MPEKVTVTISTTAEPARHMLTLHLSQQKAIPNSTTKYTSKQCLISLPNMVRAKELQSTTQHPTTGLRPYPSKPPAPQLLNASWGQLDCSRQAAEAGPTQADGNSTETQSQHCQQANDRSSPQLHYLATGTPLERRQAGKQGTYEAYGIKLHRMQDPQPGGPSSNLTAAPMLARG